MQQSPWCPRTVGGSKQDCAVCMDVCGSEGGVIKLGCSHSFCRQCIATHAARQVRHTRGHTRLGTQPGLARLRGSDVAALPRPQRQQPGLHGRPLYPHAPPSHWQVRHSQPPSCPLCKGQLSEAEVAESGPAKEMADESDDEGGEDQVRGYQPEGLPARV